VCAFFLSPSFLPEGLQQVIPGDNVTFEISLLCPIAMAEGLRFVIREAGLTIGVGMVVELIE
jgi:elongation factor Tu